MSTIKDVAFHAGMSVAVVSKYLKNPSSVRTDTRERVEKAITDLRYTPSPVARSLRTGKSGVLLCVYPTIRNVVFNSFIHMLQQFTNQAHKSTIIISEDHMMSALSGTSVDLSNRLSPFALADGVIFCMCTKQDILHEISSLFSGKPQVSVLRNSCLEGVPNLTWDNEYSIYQATHHLIDMGHKRIAYVCSSPYDDRPNNRHIGYRRAMNEAGLYTDSSLEYCYTGIFNSVRGGYTGMEYMMELADRPTAIVTDNDFLAMGCCHYAHMNGLRVPEDIALTGLFDSPPAEIFFPPITSVPFPSQELARLTSETMQKLLEGKPDIVSAIPQDIQIKTNLIVRRSSDITKPLYSIPDMQRI